MRSLVIVSLSLAACAGPGRGQPSTRPDLGALVDQHCLDCHYSGRSRGDLSLEGLDYTRPADRPDIWERVLRKLEHRQMPPVEEPRPEEAEYRGITAYLTAELDRAAPRIPGRGGPTPCAA